MLYTKNAVREILVIVSQLRDYIEGDDRTVKVLERRVQELEKQNRELFDRLMSRDWETYASYSTTGVEEPSKLRRFSDDLAGDIVEIGDAEHEAE